MKWLDGINDVTRMNINELNETVNNTEDWKKTYSQYHQKLTADLMEHEKAEKSLECENIVSVKQFLTC